MARPVGLAALAAAFDGPARPVACGAPCPDSLAAELAEVHAPYCNRPAGHRGHHLITNRAARRLACWPAESHQGPAFLP